MNTRLPRDIRVLYSEETTEEFHARFSAKNKTYSTPYKRERMRTCFTRDTALHVHTPLDVERIQRAAKHALGEHDFVAFMSTGSTLERTVRTVFRSEWTRDGRYLYYDVSANGFLYNMVRILVGTMLEIGSGKLPEDAIARAIASKRRDDAGATAPPQGLALMRVQYEDFDTDEVLNRL